MVNGPCSLETCILGEEWAGQTDKHTHTLVVLMRANAFVFLWALRVLQGRVTRELAGQASKVPGMETRMCQLTATTSLPTWKRGSVF